jgi:DNA-binding response OmpR family regulator
MADEVGRRHPGDPEIAAMRNQLAEEVERVTDLLRSCEPRADQGHGPVTVLVADDDESSRTSLSIALRQLGHCCRTARNGEEALAEFEREPTQIVLADWSMPGMSGLELCVELKRMTHAPYFILATAFHESEHMLEATRGNVDDFLCKPVDLKELEARLSAALRLLAAYRGIAGLQHPSETLTYSRRRSSEQK